MKRVLKIIAGIALCVIGMFFGLAFLAIPEKNAAAYFFLILALAFLVPGTRLLIQTAKDKQRMHEQRNAYYTARMAESNAYYQQVTQQALQEDIEPTSELVPNEQPLPPTQEISQINFYHNDLDDGLEQPEWADLPYLDAEAVRFWNGKTTDFKIPSYYSDTAFGRNVGSAKERLLSGGYLREGDLRKNIERKTIPELKAVLADRELKTSGKKAELVQRLLDNVPPDELYEFFPVGVYEITEKGLAAIAQYTIIEENKDYNLGFSFYRLIRAKETALGTDDSEILGQLISDDLRESYRNGNRQGAERLLPYAARFALGHGDPEKALTYAVLAYFLWVESASRISLKDPNEMNPYLAAMVEEYAVQCRFSLEQMFSFFSKTVQRENPFGLGTPDNTKYALAALQCGLFRRVP